MNFKATAKIYEEEKVEPLGGFFPLALFILDKNNQRTDVDADRGYCPITAGDFAPCDVKYPIDSCKN